jgi:hypothetical protein
MGSIGTTEVLIILSLLLIIVSSKKIGIKKILPVLVLRKFSIEKIPSNHIYLDIRGRSSGIISYILTNVGVDSETSLKLTENFILFKSTSLYGQVNNLIPLTSISSTNCGYSKPFSYIILSIISLFGGLFLLFSRMNKTYYIGSFLISGLFILGYILEKKLIISVETYGGQVIGLIFKRSVIENLPIDINSTINATNLINLKVINSQKRMINVRENIEH